MPRRTGRVIGIAAANLTARSGDVQRKLSLLLAFGQATIESRLILPSCSYSMNMYVVSHYVVSKISLKILLLFKMLSNLKTENFTNLLYSLQPFENN